MCGIAGWIDTGRNLSDKQDTILAMSGSLKRRGPDQEGLFLSENALLGHRRLIVIDPEGGKQPMTFTYKGETYTLIYNGELYNTEELRRQLKSCRFTFWGHSDTEVLLKAYAFWGEKVADKLNGIYAFAVWHGEGKKLFACRDRAGVKPFFYYAYKGGIIFASEIKALLENDMVPKAVDSYGLSQLLLLGPGRSCGSGVIKNVRELMPGQFLVFEENNLRVSTYWSLKAREHADSPEQTIERTRDLITDVVKSQLVSDVPLACFLSGGLDSSIISYIAADSYRRENKKLATYSVDYQDNDKYFTSNSYQPDSDKKYIEIMSDFIGSEHNNIVLDNLSVAESLIEASDARDLPGMADIDSSLLLFCRFIKEGHTVCLSGECADEIFGGYPWYHREEILYKEIFPWSDSIALRKKLFKKEFVGPDPEGFVREEYEKTIALADCLPSDDRFERRMREMFILNYYSFMQTLLDRKDRMSMYSSLEVRVPFCDYRLVEYSFNMPWKYKALDGREKGIVRRAFKDILPDQIVFRKKSPYPKTFNPIFLEYVRAKAKEAYERGGILKQILNRKFFMSLAEENTGEIEPWYGQLMRTPQIFAYLLQLDAFFSKYNLSVEM